MPTPHPTLARFINTAFSCADKILDAMDAPRSAGANDPAFTRLSRDCADYLELWTRCGHRACARAQCCRRPATDCLARFGRDAPLRGALQTQIKARRRALARSRAH